MAYVFGEISKFKRVEAAIRKTLKSHRSLIDVIDNAMPKNKEVTLPRKTDPPLKLVL